MTDPPPASITGPPCAEPQRILVRGVNWLGDAVMTTPALHRLRERFPQAHITLLTHEKLADLWLHHPGIDEVITFAAGEGPWAVARTIRTSPFGGRVAALRRRSEGTDRRINTRDIVEQALPKLAARIVAPFDLALVLPNSPRSALEVWLASIPRRVGYSRPWRNWLLTQTVPTRPGHASIRKRSVSEIKRLIRSPPGQPQHQPRDTQDASQQLSAPAPPSPCEARAGRGPGRGDPSGFEVYPISSGATAHQIHHYLQLVAALGADPAPVAPFLHVTPPEVGEAVQRFGLEIHDQPGLSPLFGLNAGAEYGPAKRWPKERFIAAAVELQRRTHCRWLIFGGKAEAALAREIAEAIQRAQPELTQQKTELPPILNLAGKTTLRELMALLKLCRVVLTNDSGPMHVAAALGTPVVVPFGSTSPELTGPGLPGDPRHRLLTSEAPCAPCFRRVCPIDFRCMTGISVERVVEAVLQAAGSEFGIRL